MRLKLFADYFQFYLQDDDVEVGNLAESWTEDATQRLRIAVAPGVVGVGTARNATVDVDVELVTGEPPLDEGVWVHVVEADLKCSTGRIVVAGCTDYFPDARRLKVEPGRYRVRVLYGPGGPADDSLGDLMAYRVQLWRSSRARAVKVLRQGPTRWAG